MYKSDDEHRKAIVKEVGSYINNKYLKGQAAHGGHLWRKNLTPHAVEEAADLVVYLFTKREQETKAISRIKNLISFIDQTLKFPTPNDMLWVRVRLNEIKNILTIGNPEGIEEEELEG